MRRIMNDRGEEPSVTGALRNGVTPGEEGQRWGGGGEGDEAKKHRTPGRDGE